MSRLVAIDTSGKGGAVALAHDGRLLARVDHDPAQGYAEELFGLLDAALDRAGLPLDAIEAIAVVRGPGSFTGLRIGVMTAKTLAHARGWKLWAADTLPLLAAGVEAGRPALAVAPAGGDQVWSARYGAEDEDGRRATLDAPRRSDLEMATRAAGESVVAAADPALGQRLGLEGSSLPSLAETLAVRASRGLWPATSVDPVALLPDYAALSQAERVHDVDLRELVNRPIRPRSWES